MNLDTIYLGDCLEVLKGFPENSIDSIVTDPPYGLSFMGKKWDYDVPSQAIWEECLRVLKPGGHLLAFAGTRTQHRMAVRIEDAGFEIRDMIAWIYGSGFPKSLNIGKAVDKLQGNEREVLGKNPNDRERRENSLSDYGLQGGVGKGNITQGLSEFEGWGTALKPALEPITVARKPISEKSIAENVLKWNTGGINIDGCRVEGITEGDIKKRGSFKNSEETKKDTGMFSVRDIHTGLNPQGRFPANLIHDGSEEVLSGFPETKSGALKPYKEKHQNASSYKFEREKTFEQEANSGSASRFFYCAKSSKSERNEGCEGLEKEVMGMNFGGELNGDGKKVNITANKNNHPTVKPIALMEYLVKLVTPKGGIVLDPFAGSGSTLIAAKKLGFNYIGTELNPEYITIAKARLKAVEPQLPLSLGCL